VIRQGLRRPDVRLAAFASLLALSIAGGSRQPSFYALDDVLLISFTTLALFALAGLGPTRLLLPEGLRGNELLWVLPVGACTCAIALTVLGYAAVPLQVSMIAVPLAGLGLAVFAFRRHGPPRLPAARRDLVLPLYVAMLVALVSLVPMLRFGFPTVEGNGSDAHLAAGTAQFLQHNYPTSVNVDEPLDQMHLAWRSKAPIYYPFAAVAELSGYETYQVLATVAAIMGALAALGAFLFARELLRADLAAAIAALGLVGVNRMVLHTIMHPYFNQTWGWFAMFFSLVLAWWAVSARSRGGVILLVLFLAVGAFAYPLALPIPLVALGVFIWRDRAERRARGEPVTDIAVRRRVRGLYRGPVSLLWMVPLALTLAIPVVGVIEKAYRATQVLLPGHSLSSWGGDLFEFFPEQRFLGLSFDKLWWVAAIAMALLMRRALRERPAPLAWGLGAVVGFGVLAALYLRPRDHGYYFHFKALAFIAPVLVACAIAGARGLRPSRWSTVLLVLYALIASNAALKETRLTFIEIDRPLEQLRQWDRELPASASVRLDIVPDGSQLWAAYFFYHHPVCSQQPLLGTDYPHVAIARKADYAVIEARRPSPADSTGAPVLRNKRFKVYRLRADTPGPAGCSKRLVRTQTKI
jgi:hypothetical protein